MNFSIRSPKKELLDFGGIPFEAIRKNMKELEFINKYLGGHNTTIDGFKQLANSKKEITVCEIGCGGGDNLMAIYSWCKKENIDVRLIGIDINSNCIAIAKSKYNNSAFNFLTSDYRDFTFTNSRPEIIFSSLFCHHFNNEELEFMFSWMMNNSSTGFFINDLHRNSVAYHSIHFLTKIFSNSYLVKNDAPLSVLRGFVRKEWELILERAGLNSYSLQWKWAFRWLLVVKHKM
jgi:2-polyprenyl-3-methyl-5-hydroxy-6-metoxy-1,4-benzoquinol methylase